jgi:hypothetical protein
MAKFAPKNGIEGRLIGKNLLFIRDQRSICLNIKGLLS